MAATSVTIQKVQTQDRVLTLLQQNVITGVGQIQKQLQNTPSNGVFVTVILVPGNNTFQHSLQSVPQGFLITDIDAAALVYRVKYTNVTVTLNSSTSATAVIFLF